MDCVFLEGAALYRATWNNIDGSGKQFTAPRPISAVSVVSGAKALSRAYWHGVL